MNKRIWKDQYKFNEAFLKDLSLDIKNLSGKEKLHWVKEFFFHINKELTDLVNCIPNWKMHYRYDEKEPEFVNSNLIEEYVDVFKYLMGLGQILGISFEDIEKGYEEKTKVVKQKYKQNKKFNELSGKPVIIFDIDGVINNFPVCFLDWVKKEKNMNYKSLDVLKKSLGLKAYESLKTEYRLSGEKRHQPINKETVETMKELKDSGEKIILFTTRPVSRYKVINSDTLYWLKNNKIPFDAIYWSDFHEKEDIYKFKFKIKFIVEDSLENAKNFNKDGHLVFLVDNCYNRDKNYKHEKLIRIKSAKSILKKYKNDKLYK